MELRLELAFGVTVRVQVGLRQSWVGFRLGLRLVLVMRSRCR